MLKGGPATSSDGDIVALGRSIEAYSSQGTGPFESCVGPVVVLAEQAGWCIVADRSDSIRVRMLAGAAVEVGKT